MGADNLINFLAEATVDTNFYFLKSQFEEMKIIFSV